MTTFLSKYEVKEAQKLTNKLSVSKLSPEETNRQKLSNAIAQQIKFIEALEGGRSVSVSKGDKDQMPRLFWSEIVEGFFFTPRFGNEFIFGKDRGISAKSWSELKSLLSDFGEAIGRGEFDERLTEISDMRKGRGAGVKRKRTK